MLTHRRPRPLALAMLIAALGLAAAACGGDDSTAAPEDGSACAGTDLAFTNHVTGESGRATAALATSEFDGGIYVAHAADFDIGENDVESWRPEVPEGSNVITVQLTVFNAPDHPEPVAAGSELDLTIEPETLTFLVRHFTTDDDWSEAQGIGVESDGRMTVTGVGDIFCFEIDYHDQDKEISGTVEAAVVGTG